MKCFQCEEDARAICQFCGQATCKKHRGTKRFIGGFGKSTRSHAFDNGSKTGVLVEAATWCGHCEVQYQTTY